jgi:hypothetical protein
MADAAGRGVADLRLAPLSRPRSVGSTRSPGARHVDQRIHRADRDGDAVGRRLPATDDRQVGIHDEDPCRASHLFEPKPDAQEVIRSPSGDSAIAGSRKTFASADGAGHRPSLDRATPARRRSIGPSGCGRCLRDRRDDVPVRLVHAVHSC